MACSPDSCKKVADIGDFMNDDTNCSLDELRTSRPRSLVSELIEIQKCKERRGRDFSRIRELECLSIRRGIQGQDINNTLDKVTLEEDDREFAAVSYMWQESAFENPERGKYHIKPKNGQPKPAQVRNVVLDRVLKYIISKGVSRFWIDQECIDQSNHRIRDEIIQSMDIIYRRSLYPIGILSTPLRSQEELNDLCELVEGRVVQRLPQSSSPQLRVNVSRANRFINVLYRLMCDSWWSRRWIFQEEYCTSGHMRLLISHNPGLIKPNDMETFGNIADELAIKTGNFRVQVTRFCIAYLGSDRHRSKRGRRRCSLILERAKSYMMLRKYGSRIDDVGRGLVMSTRILADLYRRSVSMPSDTLSIMANCCGYGTRLRLERLKEERLRSLSLAMLALFILNGEILRNDLDAHDDTVKDFIKRHSLRGFDPPRDDRHLTFMKRCRLPSVVLCEDGVKSKGYLWQTCQFFKPQGVAQRANETGNWRAALQQIAQELPKEQFYLRKSIERYLNGTFLQVMSTVSLQEIFENMIKTVVQAASEGKGFALARLQGHKQASAIFMLEGAFEMKWSIFTACEPADDGTDERIGNVLDKYVSLRVDSTQQRDRCIPHLRPTGWINGIWFPGSRMSQEVMFPWPKSLRAMEC